MTAAEMLALADRCEKASGPDRDLERLIWSAVGSPAIRPIPVYTASLDAAMSLVPDGWDCAIYTSDGVAHAGCSPSDPDVRTADTDDAMSATAALALCAAALRARTALLSDQPA